MTRAGKILLPLLFVTLPTPALAKDVSPKDFDLTCAITVSVEMGINPKIMGDPGFDMLVFYIGRLTGRDDSTDWAAVVHGRVAELKDKARGSAVFVQACAKFFLSKTK